MTTKNEAAPHKSEMLRPELLVPDDQNAIYRDGRRLDHAEGSSKPQRPNIERQPRGANIRGNRPVNQAEAAARFIAAPEHEKMHDERLWDLRQKRDREMQGGMRTIGTRESPQYRGHSCQVACREGLSR